MQRFSEAHPIGREPLRPNQRPSLRDDGLNALATFPIPAVTQPKLADARSPKPSDTPRVKVAKDLDIEWDLAKIVRKTEELTGGGRYEYNCYACGWNGATVSAQFNKMCSDKNPHQEGKT